MDADVRVPQHHGAIGNHPASPRHREPRYGILLDGRRRTWIQLIFAAILPLLLSGGLVAYFAADRARSDARRAAADTTARVAERVSAELAAQLDVMQTLAGSAALRRDDIPTFREEVERIKPLHPLWFTVELATPSGDQVLNLLRPAGQSLGQTADRESWPAARMLAALLEHEIAERAQRRTARHLLEARLPIGKTVEAFDFAAVPSLSKARVLALAEGDAWLTRGTNILLFGPPGVGKSHLGAALGHAMVDAGYRVLFTRTTDLVQHLQAARHDLKLAGAIEKLDKYHLLILDDLSYVQKSQAETSVIFELIAARYERRSMLITANQPFGAWDAIFPDPAMTVAAIDRLVHHSIILEMNTDSYRRKSAEARRPGI